MNILSIATGPLQANCHLLWGDGPGALVIDPGAEAERILGELENRSLEVAAYPLTHGHMDHVCALSRMLEVRPAPVGLHPLDASWAFEPVNEMPPVYVHTGPTPEIERSFEEGQEWTDAGLTYRVLETPGHSPGGVCFHFPDHGVLVAGDTLFRGSIGRTDLPGGNARDLAASLQRLAQLPDDTRVLTGHGPETTIAHEKATNYFLRNSDWV